MMYSYEYFLRLSKQNKLGSLGQSESGETAHFNHPDQLGLKVIDWADTRNPKAVYGDIVLMKGWGVLGVYPANSWESEEDEHPHCEEKEIYWAEAFTNKGLTFEVGPINVLMRIPQDDSTAPDVVIKDKHGDCHKFFVVETPLLTVKTLGAKTGVIGRHEQHGHYFSTSALLAGFVRDDNPRTGEEGFAPVIAAKVSAEQMPDLLQLTDGNLYVVGARNFRLY